VGIVAAIWMLWAHQWTQASVILTGLATTNAGVYYGSTSKVK